MKKLLLILVLISTFILCAHFVSKVYASDSRTVKVTTLNPAKNEKRNFYIVTGESVEVTGEVNGDVYALGGQIAIDAKVEGDVIVIGGTINFDGETSDDLRIIGGQVDVSGTVGKNLTVVSGDFRLLEDAKVLGGLASAAGNIYLDGDVDGEAKLAAGNVNLADHIGSNVEIWSDSITVSSKAEVGGELVYHSESDISLSNEASVSGTISRANLPTINVNRAKFDTFKKSLHKVKLFSKTVSFASSLIVGLLLLKFFPKCLKSSSDLINTKFGKVLLAGAIFLFLTPFVLIVLLITVIGLPIAFMGFSVYGIFIYLSKIFFSLWLGDLLVKRFSKNTYLYFSVGLLLFYLLKLIIFVNFIVSLSALVLGLGAAVLGGRDFYKRLIKAKIV